jgi:hypothetical protein
MRVCRLHAGGIQEGEWRRKQPQGQHTSKRTDGRAGVRRRMVCVLRCAALSLTKSASTDEMRLAGLSSSSLRSRSTASLGSCGSTARHSTPQHGTAASVDHGAAVTSRTTQASQPPLSEAPQSLLVMGGEVGHACFEVAATQPAGAHRVAFAPVVKLLALSLHLVVLLLDVAVAAAGHNSTTARQQQQTTSNKSHPMMTSAGAGSRAFRCRQHAIDSPSVQSCTPLCTHMQAMSVRGAKGQAVWCGAHNDSCVTSGQVSSEGLPISLKMWSSCAASLLPAGRRTQQQRRACA